MNNITLNPQQVEAVSHRDGPMIVLSVAGSGKTLVLTERIIHLIENGIEPARLLAITFAKKAVLEIQSRLGKRFNGNGNRALVCTFHSLGYRILKAECPFGAGIRLVHDADQLNLFHRAMEEVGLDVDPALLMRKVSLAKNDMVSPENLVTSTQPEIRDLGKVYACYELFKRRKRVVDFDDLLFLPYQILNANESIRERYQNRFHHILIDEFQDSSKVMVELVKMLSQSHRNVWLAGDDDQSIHGFRGAKPDIFVSFGKEYELSAKTITMSHNYRSTRNIIEAANNLISHNKKRFIKEMITDNGDGEEVAILATDNEIAEAEAIAEKVLELAKEGYRYDEIAVLVRIHRLMPLIEAALIKEKIPYHSLGEFLYDRKCMKTAVAAIRYLFTGYPTEALDLVFLNEVWSDLYPHHAEMSLRGAFEIACTYVMIRQETEYIDEEAQILKRTYMDALEYLVSQHQDLDGFLAHIEQSRKINKSPPRGRINLMTIHQAKGLEFRCVIVPGLNEGLLPHVNSVEDLVNLEEERRLMYVAMTRAMDRLVITYRRTQRGQPITSPSRFISELSAHSPAR